MPPPKNKKKQKKNSQWFQGGATHVDARDTKRRVLTRGTRQCTIRVAVTLGSPAVGAQRCPPDMATFSPITQVPRVMRMPNRVSTRSSLRAECAGQRIMSISCLGCPWAAPKGEFRSWRIFFTFAESSGVSPSCMMAQNARIN